MTRSVKNRRRILAAVGRDVPLPDDANVPDYAADRRPNNPMDSPPREAKETDSSESA